MYPSFRLLQMNGYPVITDSGKKLAWPSLEWACSFHQIAVVCWFHQIAVLWLLQTWLGGGVLKVMTIHPVLFFVWSFLYFSLCSVVSLDCCFFFSAVMGRGRAGNVQPPSAGGFIKKTIGGLESYECIHCGKQYACRHTCEGHVNKHHLQLKPYECATCGKHFFYYSSMLRHVKVCGRMLRLLQPSFACYVCGTLLPDRRSFNSHVESHVVGKTWNLTTGLEISSWPSFSLHRQILWRWFSITTIIFLF